MIPLLIVRPLYGINGKTPLWGGFVILIAADLARRRRRAHWYVLESVGIATGLPIAVLHHAGLASLTHTPSPMGFLSDILERPANERPVMLVVTGYPAPDAVVPSISRKPLDAIATFR